jgi:FtsP/CotA-like multicopper oxidase with cupredoxin domain
MMHNILKRANGVLPALVLLLTMAAGTAWAATYDLCAGQSTVVMPDGAGVSVWGFALDTGGECIPSIPGPTLRVDPADTTLTVNLRNTLGEPVSLQILGQQLADNGGPVWDNGAAGIRTDFTLRVRSFSHEAAPGGSATYTWGTTTNPFKTGTWQIQSATDVAKQVQMGLSAPVIKDAALGVAYPDNPATPLDESVPYDREVILVFQEIDPDIHAAVAAGTYGPGGTVTSNSHRDPAYFLINGMAYPNPGLNPLNAVTPVSVGERALIRFINAGGENHVPLVLNNYLQWVAEDGIPLKFPQERYGLELNPGKTLDAIFAPTDPGKVALLDGRLNLTNAGISPGGMLAYLNVGSAPGSDIVTLGSVVHDPVAQTLMVVANSSSEPNVQLTAQGYGLLNWRSWLNPPIYRTTFSNVPTRPTSVFVTSSGGGSATYNFPVADTVTIQNVSYSTASGGTLAIVATSSNQPAAILTAPGYGALGWKSWLNFYRTTFTEIGAKPTSVTVVSSSGGSDTKTVP